MPSLTRAEAVARAAVIRVAHYAIDLDLTAADTAAPTFTSSTTIAFSATGPTFVDVKAERVDSVVLNGAALEVTVEDGRCAVPARAGDNKLVVTATMRYSTDGEGLHRHVDPADGQTYLYAMSFLDAAPRWFACFDQPDLKARYDVSLRCPAGWVVLGNGAATQTASGWTLATTEPLSTYFVSVVAGPYHSVRDVHDGIPLGLHARASLAEHLDREAPEILAVTKAAFDHYHRRFGVRYPFGEYHQAFVPDFNAGAMENPGCVTLRDGYVFSSAATRGERGQRANTIVHEMAHMWFGDLVTMTWWDDLWLNESFAEYMAHRVCAEVTDYPAWSSFGIARKDWGYVADQSPSTHPVAGNGAPDAAAALAAFDGISYAKGAAVLRQLAAFLGDDVFFAGLRRHFASHAFGNAEFADLVTAWEAAGGGAVSAWAAEWLQRSGLDTLTAAISDDAVTVMRTAPDASNRSHSVGVATLSAGGSTLRVEPVVIATEPLVLQLAEGEVLAVADAHDDTWAKIRFGPAGWDVLLGLLPLIGEPLTRVVAYNAVRDAVRDAELDPRRALDALLEAVVVDPDDLVVASLLDFAIGSLAGPYAPVAERPRRLDQIAAGAQRALAAAVPGSDRQLTTLRALIRSTGDETLLGGWLAGRAVPPGLRFDAELRWAALERLASLGAASASAVDDEFARDRSASGSVHAARARALRPDPAAKALAWEVLTRPSTLPAYELYATATGFFGAGHDDVTAPYVSRFFTELPATAAHRSGWALERIALLAYPSTSVRPQTLEWAEAAIAAPDLDSRVRRALVDATDMLRRAVASQLAFPT